MRAGGYAADKSNAGDDMAGFQSAQRRLDDDADIDDWMAQRNADLQQLGPDAAAVGREAWAQSTRTGQNLSAVQPSGVAAIGAQALGQDASPMQEDPEAESPLTLATIEPAISPVELPDADNLTSLPVAFRRTSRFATARPGDSISGLLRTSDPAEVGKFLSLNGLDGRSSTLSVGQNYAIPDRTGDASPDELAAGRRLFREGDARLAGARSQQASMQAGASQASALPAKSIGVAPPVREGTIQYGALRATLPSDQELAELRRQQVAFSKTTRQIDIQNSGYAIPALAAPLAALGLGAVGAWAAGELAPAAEGVLDFLESDPYLRVGDNWSTRIGRQAHKLLEDRLAAKDGWEPQPKLLRPGQRPLRPDVGTPSTDPADAAPKFYMELKPNTPSGRAAAARAVKRYQGLTDKKIRPIYYDPKDFM